MATTEDIKMAVDSQGDAVVADGMTSEDGRTAAAQNQPEGAEELSGETTGQV